MKELILFLYHASMAAPHLKIDPDDCSAIGLLILEHINEYKLTFTEMAEKIGISRAALRIACLKQGNPGKRTIPKLALVLNCTVPELCRMICENKLRQMYEDNDDSVNLTLEAIDSFVKIIYKRIETLPEKENLNEYDIYQHALKSVTKLPE
jgi:transcriptional regulator with XRE-family HTH domain